MKIFRSAVLLIHGFAGGVYDAEYLDHQLELNWKFDVYSFTLPGHDGDTSKKIKYLDWLNKAEAEVEFLIKHGYRRIYVIGHSMGGVIATHLASKYKEIKKLVLIAPAFRFISFEDGNFKPFAALKKTPKILEQYGAKLITSRMTKLPTSAVSEFITLVKKNQSLPTSVTIPVLIIQGTSDTIVPPKTAEYVFNTLYSKRKKIVYLEGITHDIFREKKKDIAANLIEKFLKRKSNLLKFKEKY